MSFSFRCANLYAMDKPTSVSLTPTDRKRVAKLRRFLTKQYGKVNFTFIVREALRELENAIEAAEKKVA